MKEIVAAKKSKAVLVPAPPFAIKLAMGEMSEMLLSSQRCAANKIIATGFRFKFADIYSALQNIYKK
jgi:NAD dependent epimerase/dehydratase family enzyme